MCKAHWLRALMITGLAILHSEMAEAEGLRLECSIKIIWRPKFHELEVDSDRAGRQLEFVKLALTQRVPEHREAR